MKRKVCESSLGDETALGSTGGLRLKEPVEEVDITQRLLGRLLCDWVEEVGHALELQPLEVRLDALVGDAHARPS